jgi:uncharacterized protein YdaU (DUF1376 family)
MAPKKQDRVVFRNEAGEWANKRVTGERASSLHGTQAEAEAAARRQIKDEGGGELTTMNRHGQIRSKDTIGGGNDPRSVRDTEH